MADLPIIQALQVDQAVKAQIKDIYVKYAVRHEAQLIIDAETALHAEWRDAARGI